MVLIREHLWWLHITSCLILSTLKFINVKRKLKLLLIGKAEIEAVGAGAGLMLGIHGSGLLSCGIGYRVHLQKILTWGKRRKGVKKAVS